MFRTIRLPLLVIFILLVGCIPVGQIDISIDQPTGTPTSPEATATLPTPEATATLPPATDVPTPTASPVSEATATPPPASPTDTPVPTATPSDASEEAILILAPGPGSRLISPLHVSGEADTTFEQALVVRLVLADGTELAVVPTIIQSPMGERGAFEADVEFSVSGEQQAFLQVYSASARDGGLTHLSSVGVLLADSGAEDIRPVTDTSERIRIDIPSLGAAVSGGMVHVEGFALASFEQTLIVEVVDENGTVIAGQPVIVNAPDLGFPGTFSIDLPYSVASVGAGRIVVRDPSAAFDGDVHLASVEVTLAP